MQFLSLSIMRSSSLLMSQATPRKDASANEYVSQFLRENSTSCLRAWIDAKPNWHGKAIEYAQRLSGLDTLEDEDRHAIFDELEEQISQVTGGEAGERAVKAMSPDQAKSILQGLHDANPVISNFLNRNNFKAVHYYDSERALGKIAALYDYLELKTEEPIGDKREPIRSQLTQEDELSGVDTQDTIPESTSSTWMTLSSPLKSEVPDRVFKSPEKLGKLVPFAYPPMGDTWDLDGEVWRPSTPKPISLLPVSVRGSSELPPSSIGSPVRPSSRLVIRSVADMMSRETRAFLEKGKSEGWLKGLDTVELAKNILLPKAIEQLNYLIHPKTIEDRGTSWVPIARAINSLCVTNRGPLSRMITAFIKAKILDADSVPNDYKDAISRNMGIIDRQNYLSSPKRSFGSPDTVGLSHQWGAGPALSSPPIVRRPGLGHNGREEGNGLTQPKKMLGAAASVAYTGLAVRRTQRFSQI